MASRTSLSNSAPPLAGIIPALVTPLTGNQDVNVPVLERLLDAVYKSGVHGVYLCGNTGEGKLLPPASRRLILETAMRCSPPGKIVIAHVGSDDLNIAVDLAAHAADLGVHAISSLPPNRDFAAIHGYYAKLTPSTRVPFLIYYFPDVAPGIRTLPQIEELAALPNVAGLKFTDFDLYRLSMLSRRGLILFNGRDEVLAAGLLMGAAGAIGSFYNVVPQCALNIYRAACNADFVTARTSQDRLNDLITACLKYPLIPALKQILGWRGFDCGPSLGSRELTRDETSELRRALDLVGDLA